MDPVPGYSRLGGELLDAFGTARSSYLGSIPL